ncbi:MAG: nucleotidyltransferase family protein [Campylobacterota bacterium]|nr:nucleotidyltransferase family protein [Campylobacterota bacterium]
MRFLITCCQADISKEDRIFLHSYLTQSIDIGIVMDLANQHGVTPIIYKKLQSIDSQNSNLLSDLKQRYSSIAQINMMMSAELIRLMKIFGESSIEALAFKGPTLSKMLYGDITLRQFGDLDILIQKKDIYRIDSILKSQGYERIFTLSTTQEKVWIKHMHDIGYVHSSKGILLEMHWSFLDEDYPLQVQLEDFWNERQEVDILGHTLSTFSTENMLLYLSIHGSKHLWKRIEWIKDLDVLIRKSVIDWDILVQKITNRGFEKMVYLGLYLSYLLFDTPLPKVILEKIENHSEIDDTVQFIVDSWQYPKGNYSDSIIMLKLFPGFKEKILYLHKVIIKPSRSEYNYIDFPKSLYFLYYFVRPYLLIKKYFKG